jgi:CheY-like chemotaxis protein
MVRTPTQPASKRRQDILLVEDHRLTRESLTKLLRNRGYSVLSAANSREALQQAQEGDVGVAFMDNILYDEMDRISLAKQIQRAHPDASIFFVSASPLKEIDKRRVEESGLRVSGFLDKNLPELIELIEKVLGGAQIEEIRPLRNYKEESILEITSEIDQLYDQIRDLVSHHAGSPSLKEMLRPLRRRLEELEEMEADDMERRFRSRLLFDPAQGRQLLDRAESLLKRR